jgi:hypothetical protein
MPKLPLAPNVPAFAPVPPAPLWVPPCAALAPPAPGVPVSEELEEQPKANIPTLTAMTGTRTVNRRTVTPELGFKNVCLRRPATHTFDHDCNALDQA